MARGRSSEKEQFWRDTLHHWQRSGLSVSEFCRRHRLSPPSFYAWRRILAQRDRPFTTLLDKPLPPFVPVHITAASNLPSPNSSVLEVVVAGRVVRVPSGFDAATLRDLLAVLEGSPC